MNVSHMSEDVDKLNINSLLGITTYGKIRENGWLAVQLTKWLTCVNMSCGDSPEKKSESSNKK